MSVQTAVSKESPLWKAWEAYKATEDYENTARWAVRPLHTEGSMWAAFLAGFLAAEPKVIEAMFADVGLLLEALGKPNVARPISAHEVMLECIEAVKNLREKRAEHEHALRTRPDYATVRDAQDDVWIDRANRYFVGVREPRKMLKAWAPGTEVADVVMHEVWKRDPSVQRSAEQERTRIVNLLCDRCRAGEPVVERRLPNMGLGHTLPGIPHPGWARCYAEEIHSDLRAREKGCCDEHGAATVTWDSKGKPVPRAGLFTPAPGSPAANVATPDDTGRLSDAAKHARDCLCLCHMTDAAHDNNRGCQLALMVTAIKDHEWLESGGADSPPFTVESDSVPPSESPSLTRLKAKPHRFAIYLSGTGDGQRPAAAVQGAVYPAGSDEGYFRSGHRKALMVLPAMGAGNYLLTREWVNHLFDEAEAAAAKDSGR